MLRKNRLAAVLAAVLGFGALTLQARTLPETRAAAERGDADAQFELGFCYLVGCGVKEDDKAAGKWIQRAADQGHPVAKAMEIEDEKKRLEALQKLGKNGDAWAQLFLGINYMVNEKSQQGVYWIRKSAEQGNPLAQVSLGSLYLKGNVVEKSMDRAAYWYRKSAEQGNPLAQFALFGLYARGEGVPQDMEKAKYWLRKSAAQGLEDAQEALKKLEE